MGNCIFNQDEDESISSSRLALKPQADQASGRKSSSRPLTNSASTQEHRLSVLLGRRCLEYLNLLRHENDLHPLIWDEQMHDLALLNCLNQVKKEGPRRPLPTDIDHTLTKAIDMTARHTVDSWKKEPAQSDKMLRKSITKCSIAGAMGAKTYHIT